MILIYESTNLFCIYVIILEHILALFTICSNSENYSSSQSGRHIIFPIYYRVSPAIAPFFSRVPEILIFLRHWGRNLKVFSRSSTSLFISKFFI
jgi:hypothetical protein